MIRRSEGALNGDGQDMRLICPNCDAQYEVPDDVIPTSGRDVQCSNCGQTWFQYHPDHEFDEDLDAADDDAPPSDEEVATPPPPPPPPAAEPERRKLDPSVADILRQEAEAEQEARRQRQAQTLESQPDLGLETADEAEVEGDDERARDAKRRMARMRGPDAVAAEANASAAALGSRRELLPDIEEINSTLRSSSDRDPVHQHGDDATVPTSEASKSKHGFRRGFVLIVALTSVLWLVYAFAPQIAKSLPMADPYLTQYVAQVDMVRLWLDGILQSTLQWLDDKASQSQI